MRRVWGVVLVAVLCAVSVLIVPGTYVSAHFGAKLEPPDGSVYHGAYLPAANGLPITVDKINDFETRVGKNVAILLKFVGWYKGCWQVVQNDINVYASKGIVPEVIWEPYMSDTTDPLGSIIKGEQDLVIDNMAYSIRNYGKPVFLRFAHEMNGNWYPWAGHDGNNKQINTPEKYIKAWRYLYDRFQKIGATNCVFLWCPNGNSVPEEPENAIQNYYPGDEYVDWVGIDFYGLMWGEGEPEANIKNICGLFNDKPIMIAETAAADDYHRAPGVTTTKAEWIAKLFAAIKNNPNVKGFGWFNEEPKGGVDWRIQSSPDAEAAYKAGCAASSIITSVDANLPPLSPPPSGSINLALNSTATASSSNADYGETPDQAVDGDEDNTRWSSNVPGDKWLMLDLGKSYNIGRWKVVHAGKWGQDIYNTRDFKLQKSSNGTSWEDVDAVSGNTAAVTDRGVPVFAARYVRLYITTPNQIAGDSAARITEFEVYGSIIPEGNTNLALNAVATANQSVSPASGPDKAIDGSTSSKWCSTTPGDKWLELDLGQNYDITGWVVKHAGAGWEDKNYNTKDFKLQQSQDGFIWTDVDAVTGNTADITYRNLTTPINTRYIRLYITIPTQTADTAARIYEFELYRSAVTPPPEIKPAPISDTVNIALNKNATASGYTGTALPQNAVDGKLGWPSKWCSTNPGDKWLKLDLGQNYDIVRWKVKHAGDEGKQYITSDFKLQKSEDGLTWIDVDSVVGNTINITDRGVPVFNTRYVRLYITKAEQNGNNAARIYELELYGPEKIPPVTTIKIDGTEKNGWYSSDVTITLSATDNLGVDRTEYRIGDGGDWITYTGPVVMTQEGIYIIQYRSTDKAGNVEDLKQQTVKIDQTPPAFNLMVNGNVLKEGDSFDDYLPFNFKVWDNMSGVASAKITIDGIDYSIDLQTQSSIDIDLAGKVGSWTATVMAQDITGNTLEQTFRFTVTTSIDSMRHLIDRYVKAGQLGGPLFNQLTNNLDQAQHQLDNGRPDQAAKHMEDFIKHLNNQALGNYVKSDVQMILNADAEALIKMWSGKNQ